MSEPTDDQRNVVNGFAVFLIAVVAIVACVSSCQINQNTTLFIKQQQAETKK